MLEEGLEELATRDRRNGVRHPGEIARTGELVSEGECTRCNVLSNAVTDQSLAPLARLAEAHGHIDWLIRQ